MTTPYYSDDKPRYVRVTLFDRGQGLWSDRWKPTCLCRNYLGFSSDASEAPDWARRHARTCPAVRAATERDAAEAEAHQLGVEVSHLAAELTRLRDDRDRLRDVLAAIPYELRDPTP